MASHPDFVNYMAEQLREAGAIRSRKMFGEYGLYCDDVFFAVVCDDQLFVKVTPQGEAAFPDLPKGEMTMVFDNKKEHKEFYLPPKTPGIVNAPAMSFLAARGHGEPEKQAMWF